MADLRITTTRAGYDAITNIDKDGTRALRISAVALGSGTAEISRATGSLENEVARIDTIAGEAVDKKTLHVMIKDESRRAYTVREFALITDAGVMFAAYSQPEVIIEKAGESTLLLAIDIAFDDLDATQITFGDASFTNPPASESVQGVVELATSDESRKREDKTRALSPASGGAMLEDHEKASKAHDAKQIMVTGMGSFGDYKTVLAALRALGSAGRHDASDFAAADHTHDSVTNANGDRVTISATGNLDHYVGGEYLFRVNSAGKLDRASGGIDASLLTDKAPIAVIPHMIGADGRGWCGLVNDPEDEKYLGTLRLSGAGTFYYQHGGSTKFQVTSDGRVDTYGDLTGAGNLKMTGSQWTLGKMSGDDASLYMDGSRWAYASDYRIAFNPGQARTVTTAYGKLEVRADEGVDGHLYVENSAKINGKLVAGDNSGLGKFSVNGQSQYVEGNRWMYASDFRIAFNSGQQRSETTAYGKFAVDSDSGVSAEIRVDNQLVWHDGNSQKSYGASGYEVLPSGLVIQWGNASAGRNNFAIPFPNNVNKIVATDQDTVLDIVNVEYVSRSQFNVHTNDNGIVYYLAIGY